MDKKLKERKNGLVSLHWAVLTLVMLVCGVQLRIQVVTICIPKRLAASKLQLSQHKSRNCLIAMICLSALFAFKIVLEIFTASPRTTLILKVIDKGHMHPNILGVSNFDGTLTNSILIR